MRDVGRIDVILEKLRELWYQYPDQRLGQLLENYVFSPNRMFYQEDDITLENITAQIFE